ncbi:MAG: PBP1A family penicillin-binding protein [Acetivibrio sp.]
MAKKKKKKSSPGRQRVKLILKVILLLALLTLLAGGILIYMKYGKEVIKLHAEAVDLVRQSTTATFRQSETSEVYDTKGKLITTLKGEKDTYYLEYDRLPEDAKQAMISIEDKKFRKHKGIDIKGIIRAAKSYVDNHGEVTQGASTITQQIARNTFLTHEVSWQRKAKEIFIALEMEKKYTKDQILEFYLNNIYFGNGYYGIGAASKGYFSQEVNELSLAQTAFLCAIPNNPTLHDPFEHMENTIGRKNRILGQMKEDGALGDEAYREAVEEEIVLKVTKNKKQNYIETYVYNCAIRALMKSQGFTFRYSFSSQEESERYQERYDTVYAMCQQWLYSGGYRIYTSIDMKKQKQLQKAIDDALVDFQDKNEEGIYDLQSAATSIDNKNGRVVAIVGGRSQNVTGYTLNRAYQSYRQPGSAIKPLIVYTPIFEQEYTPNTMVKDAKVEGGPKNSSGRYSGNITIRTAVEQSKNTVAWNLFEELTPAVGLQYLLDMNFAKISKNDYYPAAALGGFTNGVSTVEMASAFATLENEGVFREATCIVSIVDARGNEIVSDVSETKIVYEAEAARAMTDVLKGVISRGTGRGLGIPNMSCAGKTGTTDDKKDGWFVGYTPYYTTSVWVGYDIPKRLDSLAGSTYPGTIWRTYMTEAHEGLEDIGFASYISKDLPTIEETKENEEEKVPEENAEDTENVEDVMDENIQDLDQPLEGEEPTPTPEETIPDEKEDLGNNENLEDEKNPEPSQTPEETPPVEESVENETPE